MIDLLVALGLVLVLEGLMWALAPQMGLRFLLAASQMPEQQLRIAGGVAAIAGFAIVWLIRG